MQKEEFLEIAKSWINNYKRNIEPTLATNLTYAPSDVALLLDQFGELTTLRLYYDNCDKLSNEEKNVKKLLDGIEQDIHDILMQKDAEFEELQEGSNTYLTEDNQDNEVYFN